MAASSFVSELLFVKEEVRLMKASSSGVSEQMCGAPLLCRSCCLARVVKGVEGRMTIKHLHHGRDIPPLCLDPSPKVATPFIYSPLPPKGGMSSSRSAFTTPWTLRHTTGTVGWTSPITVGSLWMNSRTHSLMCTWSMLKSYKNL